MNDIIDGIYYHEKSDFVDKQDIINLVQGAEAPTEQIMELIDVCYQQSFKLRAIIRTCTLVLDDYAKSNGRIVN